MELDQDFLKCIFKIVSEYQKPFKTGSVFWYHLKNFRARGHQDDMNRLANCNCEGIDALCLIVPRDYPYDDRTLVIVYEDSKLANMDYYPDGWHDEISMTKFKNTKYRQLHREDNEQTIMVIDCDEKYNFHLWKSPRRISAVTERCKDYGDIWKNGICVHEGNKYGDHEHFYVIGSIHRKNSRL